MTHRMMLLATATALLSPLPALAQSAPQQGAGQTSALEEIVVTARKTEERLIDAPVAVTAFSERAIENQGLRDINDLSRLSTGLSFSQTFGRSTDRPVIRGQSNVLANVQFGVESGVAYFVDGVYYPGSIQSFDIESVQRVEIIKGPQSALYGRNTYSGAINYITKDPGTELGAKVRVRAAEHDEYEASIAVSGPLVGDKLGFTAGGRYFTYGGEYTNTLTGKKVGDEETKSGYLTLVANPTENIRARFRLQYAHDNDGPLALFLTRAEDNNCAPGWRSPRYRQANAVLPYYPATRRSDNNNQFFCGVIKPRPDLVALNTDPMVVLSGVAGVPAGTVRDGTAFDGIENKQWLGSFVLDWDIGGSGWVVSSLTGYRKEKNWFGTDSDHSDAVVYTVTRIPPIPSTPFPAVPTTEPLFANSNVNRTSDFSQEFRVASPQDARIRGLAGVYYYKQKDNQRDLTFDVPREGVPFSLSSAENNLTRVENKAVFGLLAFNITDQLTLTGEVRYAEEIKKRIDNGFCAGLEEFRTTFNLAATIACSAAPKFKKTTPRITLDYKTDGGTLLYAVYAEGAKPGGINGSAGATIGRAFYDQESSKNIELGLKTKMLDGRVAFEAAGFYIDATDVQLTTALPVGAGAVTSIATNQGDAETKGFEIQFTAAPTDNLTLTLGYSYVNAKFTKGCDADYYVLNSGGLIYDPDLGLVPECDISGKKLPLGSPHILNGSAFYEREIANTQMRWFASGNFSYEASKYVQTDNFAETGDTLLVNARIGIRSDRWSIAAFGRNLTDEDSITLATRWFDLRYGSGARDIPAALTATPGVAAAGVQQRADTGSPRAFFGTLRKGRTFGVEASYSF